MPKYELFGDICRPGSVLIDAPSREAAIEKANNGDFDSIIDEQGSKSLTRFDWNGDDDFKDINE